VSILNPLYVAVAWLIMRIHQVLSLKALHLGASSGVTWVLTIVVLVVLLRLALLPLFIKQTHSQRKMLTLAPQVQELRKRYKNDKQKLNEEMMKLYKENGANPLSGCLPLVAQLPVWFALLNVLRAMTENKPLYGMTQKVVNEALSAHIFGVTVADKFLFQHPGTSWSVKLVIGITVILSATTTFITVRQSTKRGMMQTPVADDTNPMANAQKYMMYIAPLFALSGLYWQYGLVVYWLASNVWTMGQQYFLFKKIPPLTAATATAGATAGAAAVAAKPKAAAPRAATTPKTTTVTGKAAVAAKAAAAGKQNGTAARPATTGTAKAAPVIKAPPGTKGPGGTAPPKASAGKTSPGTAKASAGNAKKPAAAKTNAASLGIPPPIAESGGSKLRNPFAKRSAPEPEPEPEPEVTFVRTQRAKQSRSKRQGSPNKR